MTLGISSDPAVLAVFDRACALVTAASHGSISLSQLASCHALARAWAAGDEGRVADHAAELRIDAEALR